MLAYIGLSSCSVHERNIEEVSSSVDRRSYLAKYENYYLKPIHRRMDVILVGIDDGEEYSVRGFHRENKAKMKVSKQLHPSVENQFIKDSILHRKIHDFLSDSYELSILRYVNTGQSSVLHVNVVTSLDNGSSKQMKYVLVKSTLSLAECQVDLLESKEVYDFKNSLDALSTDWYYYTSDLFNKYRDLEDFN
jgi:hypothetical protein